MTAEQEAIERLREDVRRNPEGGTVYIDDARALLDSHEEVTKQRDYLMDGILGMAAVEKHTCPDVCFRCDLSSLVRASHERGVPHRPIEVLLDSHERMRAALEAQGYVIRTVGGTYRWHAEGCAAANGWDACISRCKKGREALEGGKQ